MQNHNNHRSFSFDVKYLNGSRPFKWAQTICQPNSEVTIESLIQAMAERWTNLKSLERCLDLFKKGSPPANLKGFIKSFKLSTEGIKSPDLRTYLVSVEIENYLFELTMDVSASFPKVIPKFTMHSESNASGEISEETSSTATVRLPSHMNVIISRINSLSESNESGSQSPEPEKIIFSQFVKLVALLQSYSKATEADTVQPNSYL